MQTKNLYKVYIAALFVLTKTENNIMTLILPIAFFPFK